MAVAATACEYSYVHGEEMKNDKLERGSGFSGKSGGGGRTATRRAYTAQHAGILVLASFIHAIQCVSSLLLLRESFASSILAHERHMVWTILHFNANGGDVREWSIEVHSLLVVTGACRLVDLMDLLSCSSLTLRKELRPCPCWPSPQ